MESSSHWNQDYEFHAVIHSLVIPTHHAQTKIFFDDDGQSPQKKARPINT